MGSNDVENNLGISMGKKIKSMHFNLLAVSHFRLTKNCLTPFLQPRYNHMHSPCYQFMRANGEAIICSRTSRVEESLKKEFSFPSDMRVFVIIVKLHLQECYSAFSFS